MRSRATAVVASAEDAMGIVTFVGYLASVSAMRSVEVSVIQTRAPVVFHDRAALDSVGGRFLGWRASRGRIRGSQMEARGVRLKSNSPWTCAHAES
jgi:hypothetical protein